MNCVMIACLATLAAGPREGAERVQEQFERHYLQDRRLAGDPDADRPPGLPSRQDRPVVAVVGGRP